MRRVVITGTGVISPVGENTDDFWDRVLNGKHNFSCIDTFDCSDFEVKYYSKIKNWNPEPHNITKKEARRMDRFCQFAVAASNQAIAQAGNLDCYDTYRKAVIYGSGVGGFETIDVEKIKHLEKGNQRVSVFFIPMLLINMAPGMIAMAHQFKGTNYGVATACATGTHSIGEAYRSIKDGYADVVITGGSESTIGELAMAGFNNMHALCRGTDPDRISIPFDKDRGGFVIGEGAGALVLEEYEGAVKRGATILAEIVGYGCTADAYHMTSPDPIGQSDAMAIKLAMQEAGVTPEQIGYMNAHGTSTPLNDLYETKAIKLAFGDHAYKLPISSTKGVTGHMIGAAGAVEAIACVKALQEGILPPTRGLIDADPECDLDYIQEGPRKADIEYALSNSLGFGGHNSCIILKKFTK